jgi:prevent-host-death family protein
LTILAKVDTFIFSNYLEVLLMGTITAKQLKLKTGEVIRRIKSGERLILTYRGKPLAVIEPTAKNEKKAADRVNESAEAWKNIESALNRTKPEFNSWREATEWARSRS